MLRCPLKHSSKGRNPNVWNKRNDEPNAPGEQAEPIRMPAPTPIAPQAPMAPAVAMNGPKQSAVIGPSMRIKGEIHAREELLVDGDVEGTLESQSVLTVGPNGKVRGNIKARQA